jgi:DNA polymerase-3 subunit delta
MATAKTSTYAELKAQLNSKKYAPAYLIHGEEGFFIDRLVEEFEAIVPEADRDFNLYELYGAETDANTVIDVCRRYPMMADHQVVILKEAQNMSATDMAPFISYLTAPTTTTVLVICGRGTKIKSKDLPAKILEAGGLVYEAVKLRDRALTDAIRHVITEKGLNVDEKGLSMLSDYVGADLSRLYNEIDKLTVALPRGSMVTPEVIESHIGMSKDFNNFELINAIAVRDNKTAFRIIDHFSRNTKDNPFPPTFGMIWTFFSNLLVIHYTRDKSDPALCAAIGRKGNWLSKDYKTGMRQYNARQVVEILRELRRTDAATKGVGSRQDPYDLLHDLIFRIFTARGVIA